MQRVWQRLFLVSLAVSAAWTPVSAQDSWPFVPEEATADRLLDLRSLNEKQSGQSGFIRLAPDGNSFVRGDGQPIRFWAIGSDLYRPPSRQNGETESAWHTRWQQRIDRHCQFLARMGVNMVRLHAVIANKQAGAAITDVNQEEIDGIFRFVKGAKENGIYLTISPYYGHHETPASWKLAGYGPNDMPWGALFIDPHMQAGYRAWTKALYTVPNPHTGLALKKDPTVAILQIHNEDSLFFWTAQFLPEPQKHRLAQAFADWLLKKYGSFQNASKAWDGQHEAGDDLNNKQIALYTTWHLTQDWQGGTAKRLRDQTQFLAEFQRDFYARMGQYLKETLGCQQLLNAANWGTANDERLKAIERWTYAALDVDAENEYYGNDYQHIGQNNGYRIDPGHFLVNESCLHKPLELTTNLKTLVGHPFIVTETSWKHPNLYQSEGPFLTAAYQSLNGVDAVYWFSATEVDWLTDPRRLFWKVGESYALDKWSCSTPMLLGMFPAAAILYRRGYLQEGEPVVKEIRSLDNIFHRQPATLNDNDVYGHNQETSEYLAAKRPDGQISRAAYLVGPVLTEFGDQESIEVSDFGSFLKPNQSAIQSNTGELVWIYNTGFCTINAPKAQGVTGFLKSAGGKFNLRDVQIESSNEYATILIVSLDDRPIQESRQVLVQVGTTARLTNWQTEPTRVEFEKKQIEGEKIVNSGKPPWQITNTKVSIALNNPHLVQAQRLTIAGRAGSTVPVQVDKGKCSLTLPTDTMYLLLTGKN